MAIKSNRPKEPPKTQKSPPVSKVENILRPKSFDEFIGQEKVIKNLRVFLEAAKKRSEPPDHILFYGPPGLGKTTLAHVIARALGVNIIITSGPAIERAGDLASILTNLNTGDILFVDEVHRLNKVVEEALYPAMEDFCYDIVIGKGPSARTLRLDLKKFTIIGATTRAGLLSSPLRDRFGIVERMSYYSDKELVVILRRTARLLKTATDKTSLLEIAKRSRGTPRVANRLLKRVRDFAQVNNLGKIDQKTTSVSLKELGVDDFGLNRIDKKLLKSIVLKHQGGPVGLETLSALISEDAQTIEEVIEPYLLQLGLLKRTPRGRMATQKCFVYLGVKLPAEQKSLLHI